MLFKALFASGLLSTLVSANGQVNWYNDAACNSYKDTTNPTLRAVEGNTASAGSALWVVAPAGAQQLLVCRDLQGHNCLNVEIGVCVGIKAGTYIGSF